MIVNAKLVSIEGGTDTPIVKMTFDIEAKDLAGLEYARPEFVLDIIPFEKLFEK